VTTLGKAPITGERRAGFEQSGCGVDRFLRA